jgi:hypothetical protein
MLDLIDTALNAAAIRFKLRFAGAARSDTAARLRHAFASAREPRQHVFELRQFDLQLALSGARVPGKDIKDELGAIEHPTGQRCVKIAQLCGGKIVIEQDEIGLDGFGNSSDFFYFAGANESRGIGPRAALQNLCRDFRAGAQNKFPEFRE